MTKKAEDWFSAAAPMVLDLDDQELSRLAIPIRRIAEGEEAVLERLALLEHLRRKAVADPLREAELERDGAGTCGYRALLADVAYRDEDGFGKRIAALVRKRPQPRKVDPGPWRPPWMREQEE